MGEGLCSGRPDRRNHDGPHWESPQTNERRRPPGGRGEGCVSLRAKLPPAWPQGEIWWRWTQGDSQEAGSLKGSMATGLGGLGWAWSRVRVSDRAKLRTQLVTRILFNIFGLVEGETPGSWA